MNWLRSCPLRKCKLLALYVATRGSFQPNSRTRALQKRDTSISQGDTMLVSYKSGTKKNMILISSMHSDSAIVVNKHNKGLSEMVSYYNATKSGVDTIDFMAHTASSKRQTKCWSSSSAI
ncbi:PiggyBac transposable element-derived protein 4 [Plakobranchus ocellatus]|uniref:PiggyBac transposable element-derived protein 4 n=1 Tax=Plakobranchus ocellatus TaxID=259542 RepID=A0AAV4DE03_9GAST|nr:PiggyBac transposable element-derived protein 4 [Plakobranchus ocellatus]